MKALVLHESDGPLVLEDVPVPRPGVGEVLLRVRACGLGLTLVWNRKGRGGAGKLPRIIGHEVAGDVVEVGPGVEGCKTGDRVNVYYYLVCGYCRWCKRAREDLCDNQKGHVGRHNDGGLAEYMKLPAINLCPLPPEISYVDAAVTADAVATPVHVLRSRASLAPGETVLVTGAGGGVGVHMVQMAKFLGARVIAVDISAEKLDLAKQVGADEVVNSREKSFDREVERITGGAGADVVVEMVGLPETLAKSANSLGKGGRLVLVGSYDNEAVLPLKHNSLRGEGIVTRSQYCARYELEEAVRLVAHGHIRPTVTRLCKLEEADAVLRGIERMELAGRACVVLA
ncbi:MAG TPA: zinc-binding dehydrogenase [Candidatus Acidoferrales bacterium]|nr:zinc-binding dehydrogenase [Candidatus Acidoferrales bacterium]